MTTQAEAILESDLVKQLTGLGYSHVAIQDEESLLTNLQSQLGAFNETTFSAKEFGTILNHLAKGNVFGKAKALRDRLQLNRDNGESFYVHFFDAEERGRNLFQVTSQVNVAGAYKTRYDVTLLINGLPLVQIELKRRGLELKEAFNQINRYQRHSFWVNSGLFQYVQIFVISNGFNTKYYANNRKQSFKQTFCWADVHNRNITDLSRFTAAFLNPNHLGRMLGQYIVLNETHKIPMVLRPYQYYAAEAIIDRVHTSRENGYIWHTTGSGKTLTSFKASQIIMDQPEVHKVVFVVDRKDLDYQTMKEFNSFKKDSVDVTDNTLSLVRQFGDDSKLILTTIQKLNNAIGNGRYQSGMAPLRDKRLVFIFDECHRSQFGDTHKRITNFFPNSQLFGFTGTPIFADNALKNQLGKRTTKDLFGDCLHKYVITDAIRDQNLLRFSVEYLGRYKQKGKTFIDIEVEDIDAREVLDSPARLEKIVDYIISHHNQKTHNRAYSAIFAVSSIESLIQYYELFQRKKEAGEHDLRIATIFSYGTNEDDQDADGMLPADYAMAAEARPVYATSHSREKLDQFIGDYNGMYRTGFSTRDGQQFENYFKDISKRLKEREKEGFPDKERLDILLVVNMFLTGFDAKKVNTLYVDKRLSYHGLIQAFSRTNRILNEQKSHGNILCFRNLKKATDDAIVLFSNKEAKEVILLPPYEDIVRKFSLAFADLLKIAPTVKSVDDLAGEDQQLAFIQAFRELMRLRNVLTSFADFSWADLPMSEQSFEDYKSKYLDLHDKVKSDHQKEKSSILEDVDFELELIHRDEINVAYILKLLARLKQADEKERGQQKKAILDMLGGMIDLRSKRELIEKFIEEHLPKIDDADAISDDFEKYWQEQKVLALGQLCEEEHLDRKQFQALIDTYIFNEQEPLRDDIFKCLDNRPSVLQARTIGERILVKMKQFVEIFVLGIAA
ncbi:MAG: type I restriction endonuclease subunit R [Proteobacteria bacterium]|nr:type I restriction endonuclease subunit R [Desulfocapsa sp.]MBU3945192.1 type I restriction endonuclease subunit R [Pseudomonadota bacterium]MCG2742785.1 type I restriction endonuclease subunit R [Desulfobacteraceae bacterium]MBU4027255.1 type I restriction endonuclease subunit R [Pseudomonadota bacterium]MBU4042883.1 type I restriction endonuclease subunit R [Pseudomonadota bacterium]